MARHHRPRSRRTGARGRSLRSAGPARRPCTHFHPKSLPLQMALVLGLRQRRPGQSGRPPIGRGALGFGREVPEQDFRLGGHFMFDDDQETPNTLNCAFQFDLPGGKRKMMEFEVRHWITDREADIGGVEMGGEKGDSNCYGDIFFGSKGYLAVGNEDMRNPYLTGWEGNRHRAPAEGRKTASTSPTLSTACAAARKKTSTRPSRKATSPRPSCTSPTLPTGWAEP